MSKMTAIIEDYKIFFLNITVCDLLVQVCSLESCVYVEDKLDAFYCI